MSIKVAVIGAGSVEFTWKLVRDILCVPELEDTVFSFIDINDRNLSMITQLAERDIQANHTPATIFATTDRRKGLEGADYVLNLTRIGGLEAFTLDVDIPLKYGVDQCAISRRFWRFVKIFVKCRAKMCYFLITPIRMR
jgi:alpha-galactosidase